MYKRINFLIIALLTFITLVTICHYLFRPKLTNPIVTLEDNWTIQYNDKSFENVSLKEFSTRLSSANKKGDILKL